LCYPIGILFSNQINVLVTRVLRSQVRNADAYMTSTINKTCWFIIKELSYVSDNITSFLSSPIEVVLNRDVILLESDRFANEAVKTMKERNARSVLVSGDKGEAVGIVSKTDILFKVMSKGKNPAKVRLRDIMNSPVLAVDPKTTIQETLSIMDKHLIRQIMVSFNAAVLGMVTREDIFERIQKATISTADAALSGTPVCIINPKAIAYTRDISTAKLSCPYCELPFDSKEELSEHIHSLHKEKSILREDTG
jgi:signal-transduction protein with cAMP-binding, CBS, and nucleotidyltransferase domain